MGWRASLGKNIAKVAKNVGKGALVVSKDPATVAEIATLVGHPEVTGVVAATTAVVQAVRHRDAQQRMDAQPGVKTEQEIFQAGFERGLQERRPRRDEEDNQR